jgi:hypothetical protein
MSIVTEIVPQDKGDIGLVEQSPGGDLGDIKHHQAKLHEAQLASLSESKGVIQTMREDTKAMLIVVVALVCLL